MKISQKTKNRVSGAVLATAFLLPALILCFAFHYYLTFSGVVYSFFDYDYANPPGIFVGIKNYLIIFKSELFWRQMKNTLIMWGIGIGLTFFIPVIQALFLNEITGKTRSVFKYLYILPMAIPGVAGTAVWRYIFNDTSGLANMLIGVFGIEPQSWLYDEKLIRWCINIPGMVGGGMGLLIYLITIEGIDKGLYEAASLDGATPFKQMWYITIPNMTYMVKLQFLLSLTSSLLAFDGPYMWTDGTGGPNKAAETLVFGIYNKAYDLLQYGQAMAMSIVIMLITLVFLGIRKLLTKESDD